MQFSESGQLAREWMLSYSQRQEFDGDDFAERILQMILLKRIVRRKWETHLAAKHRRLGRAWHDGGTPSLDNGAAARSGVLGLVYPEASLRASVVRDQARVTHQGELSISGAIVVASAVSLVCRSENELDAPDAFLAELVAESPGIHEDFLSALPQLAAWVSLDPVPAGEQILQTGTLDTMVYPYDGLSPHVVPTVLWALYCFLRTPQDYSATIRGAVTIGGDVPAVAGISGAMSGAYNGYDVLPRALTNRINDRGICGLDDLIEIAEQTMNVAAF